MHCTKEVTTFSGHLICNKEINYKYVVSQEGFFF
uniref:Uncharacterized protein n=1 Tax=Rhizophora mucronata TaxID=61149 RepID=A0A2P2P260_RHIMU